MFACARRQYLRATLYFSVAAAFRSNGVLLALYVPWSLVVHPFLLSSTLPSLSVVFAAGFHAIFPLLPSLFHQRDAYRVFCLAAAANHAQQSSWCNNLIPSIYTHIPTSSAHTGMSVSSPTGPLPSSPTSLSRSHSSFLSYFTAFPIHFRSSMEKNSEVLDR